MIKHLRITVDGTPYDVTVEDLTPTPLDATSPVVAPVLASPPPRALPPSPPPASLPAGGGEKGVVPCPLAGVVTKVEVSLGQTVAPGDVLLVLEAMKMNTPVSAPFGGTVSCLSVAPGQTVTEGQPLLTLA